MRLLTLTFLTGLFLSEANASFARLHHRAPATRTDSAVQARQLTRERLVMRSEKLTMASLFGRADCSLPEPSTLACTCGPEYTICGPLCRNTDDDPDFCGSCDNSCPPGPVGDRGCCSGACVNFAEDDDHCGSCGTACDLLGGEDCCSGACADLSANPEHCGECGFACDTANGDTCCAGSCAPAGAFDEDAANCGTCGNACNIIGGETCCGGACTITLLDNANCGACGFACAPGLTCCGGTCVDTNSDEEHCGQCDALCGGFCFNGDCVV